MAPEPEREARKRPRAPCAAGAAGLPRVRPRAPSLASGLALCGLALLAVAGAAVLLWSWATRRDELPLSVVCASAAVIALAAAFQALVSRSERAAAALERGLIAGGFAVLFFLLPHALFTDDNIRFGELEELLHHGQLSRSPFSLVMPLISVPVLALGNLVESRSWWAGRFNVIVVALGVLIAFRLLRGRVDPRLLRRIVLVMLFASFLTDRLRDYNAEVLTATLVSLGIICLATGRRPLAGWAAIVVGVANTPAAMIGLLLLAGHEALRRRRLRYLTPVAAAAALIMVENWARRGSPFTTGYEDYHGVHTVMPYSGLPGFSYPFLLGFVAILFSFGRGLLFFMPGLALWLDRRTRLLVPDRRLVTMLLLFTGGLVLVYSKWWAWYGGIAWGPRFFAFAVVPASVLLATRIHYAGKRLSADALTLGVLLLSGWVACAGIIANVDLDVSFCRGVNFQQEQLCWFTPDYSSLWQPIRQFPELTTAPLLAALYCGVVVSYLAAPLLVPLLRAARPAASWAAGWRI